jgi:hypothetical protein
MGPASVLIERIYNITLPVGQLGAWISKGVSKNWVLYWWMVATLLANKIWYFMIQDTRYKALLPLFYII